MPENSPQKEKRGRRPASNFLSFENLGFWIIIIAPEFNPVTCIYSDDRKWGWDKRSESVGYGAGEMTERM